MSARFVVNSDFFAIKSWFHARKQNCPHKSLFPKTGFIIDGIAAGFIYFTDSPIAIIDCYISNPDTDLNLRSKALDEITENLLKYARIHGCKVIKCDTKLEKIAKRALKFGFKTIGHYESFKMEL